MLSTALLITLWISLWWFEVVTLCSTGHTTGMRRLTKFIATCGACENNSHPADHDRFDVLHYGYFENPAHAQHDYFCDACGSEFDESDVEDWTHSMEVLA